MLPVTQEEHAPAAGESRRELNALVAGCGIFRSQKTLFSITGRDRVRWLNSMITNNIRDLAPGHGVYSFVLNPQGHILGDLHVFNLGESLMAEIERGQSESLLQILRRYIIMDKVEIADLSAEKIAISIAGSKAADALAAIGLNHAPGMLQFSTLRWNETELTLLRGDNPCFPNYEIWIAADQAETLLRALQGAGAQLVGDETLETFRILCGIPKVGQDIRERTLPQETGQDRALNFSKGCYIGQEIVERIRARGNVHRVFMGFEVEGNAPAPGTKVQANGKDVGEITSVMSAPLKQKRLALGYIRKEALDAGEDLRAGEAVVKARPLPFTDIFD